MAEKESISRINVNFPDSLLRRIEDYQHDHRLKNRTVAILELIEKGLNQEKPTE